MNEIALTKNANNVIYVYNDGGSIMPNIIETDDGKYEDDVIKSIIPVFIVYKSEWCPTCKRITPIVDSVSDQYKDKVKFVKIDATKNIKTSEQNSVLAIPTLIMVKAGKEAERYTGYMSEKELKAFIDKNI